MRSTIRASILGLLLACGPAFAIDLDDFHFNDLQMGDTLIESDGGAFSSANWLNTASADPGNPGYLTGAHFETGIANIGLGGAPVYTIGYNTPIVNLPGNDIGVVVARFSEDDFTIEFSQDGTSFSSPYLITVGSATGTSAHKSYYYAFGGPFAADLYVHALNLDDFGFSAGDSVRAVRIASATQLDLIRVGGLNPIPEPATLFAFTAGLLLLRRRR